MSNNLSIRVTADVSELQQKFAIARAETQALNSEFSNLAKQSAAGSLDAAGVARFQQLSGDLLAARTQAAGYARELRDAGFAATGFGTAAVKAAEGARDLGINTSSAVRYSRELFDELSSGRTRYLPSTLAELAQQGFHLSPAMLAGAGGVAALVAGLGYLVYQADKASDALDHLDIVSLRAGNDFTRRQLHGLTEELSQLPSVSSSAATSIVTALAGAHLPFEALQAASRLAAEEMVQMGEKADEAGKKIAKALEPNVTATEVAKQNQADLTQAQVDAAIAADKSGNANVILAEKLKLLSAPLSRARSDIKDYTTSGGQEFMNLAAAMGMGEAHMDPLTTEAREQSNAWHENADAISQYTAALQSLPVDKTLNFKQAKPEDNSGAALQAAQEAADIKQRMAEQEISQDKQTLDAISAAQDQARQQQLAADEQAAAAKQQMSENEIRDATRTLDAIAAAQKRADAESQAEAKKNLRAIENAEDQFISGVISGRMTLASAERSIFQRLAINEVEAAAHTATALLDVKTRSAEKAKLVKALEAQKSIMADAAAGAAAAYQSVVGIPYVGPFLAPAAAAATFVAIEAYKNIASFDVGAMNIPHDMPAMVHQGETILPRPFAEDFRAAISGNGRAGGGDTHVHINATDAESVQRLFDRNGPALVKSLQRQLRNGSF